MPRSGSPSRHQRKALEPPNDVAVGERDHGARIAAELARVE
jgi:hypothetical protein